MFVPMENARVRVCVGDKNTGCSEPIRAESSSGSFVDWTSFCLRGEKRVSSHKARVCARSTLTRTHGESYSLSMEEGLASLRVFAYTSVAPFIPTQYTVSPCFGVAHTHTQTPTINITHTHTHTHKHTIVH